MENGDEIVVEAVVHDQLGTRRSARPPANSTPAPTAKTTKMRGPKPKDPSASTSKRMTINALVVIVSDNDQAQNARVEILEREIRNTNGVLKGLGDTLERSVSAMPNNSAAPQGAPTSLQVHSAPAPAGPANLDVAGRPPQATEPVQVHSGASHATHSNRFPLCHNHKHWSEKRIVMAHLID